MLKMTDEMRDLIDNAIANGTPCILATASKAGEPHMSFRGSVMVFDDTSLALWDRVKRQSLHILLRTRTSVCCFVIHKSALSGNLWGKPRSTTVGQCGTR